MSFSLGHVRSFVRKVGGISVFVCLCFVCSNERNHKSVDNGTGWLKADLDRKPNNNYYYYNNISHNFYSPVRSWVRRRWRQDCHVTVSKLYAWQKRKSLFLAIRCHTSWQRVDRYSLATQVRWMLLGLSKIGLFCLRMYCTVAWVAYLVYCFSGHWTPITVACSSLSRRCMGANNVPTDIRSS